MLTYDDVVEVMHEMGAPYCGMQLGSVLTCSKGWAAECGLRAGLLELVRLQPAVLAAFRTARALVQCPTVLGQAALLCVVSHLFLHVHRRSVVKLRDYTNYLRVRYAHRR